MLSAPRHSSEPDGSSRVLVCCCGRGASSSSRRHNARAKRCANATNGDTRPPLRGSSGDAASAPPTTKWESPERSRWLGEIARNLLPGDRGAGTDPLRNQRRRALSTAGDHVGAAGAHAEVGGERPEFTSGRSGGWDRPPKESVATRAQHRRRPCGSRRSARGGRGRAPGTHFRAIGGLGQPPKGISGDARSAPPTTMWEPPERTRRSGESARNSLPGDRGAGTDPLRNQWRRALSTAADQGGGPGAHAEVGGERPELTSGRSGGWDSPPKEPVPVLIRLERSLDWNAEVL